MNKLLLLFLFVFCIAPSALYGKSETLLQKINNKISSVTHLIKRDKNKRDQLQFNLAHAETQSGMLQIKLDKIKLEIKQQIQQLQILQNNENNYQLQLTSQQQLLAKQLRANYILGRNPYLQMLLNEQDLGQISRTLTYYQYLNQTRANAIQ